MVGIGTLVNKLKSRLTVSIKKNVRLQAENIKLHGEKRELEKELVVLSEELDRRCNGNGPVQDPYYLEED